MKGTTNMRETVKAMKADMIAGWCEPEEKIGEPDIRLVRRGSARIVETACRYSMSEHGTVCYFCGLYAKAAENVRDSVVIWNHTVWIMAAMITAPLASMFPEMFLEFGSIHNEHTFNYPELRSDPFCGYRL